MLTDAYYAAGAGWAAATKRAPVGRNIYAHADEWDICIVLDSLRYDTLASLAPAEWPAIKRVWSRGSVTTEWLTQTFRPPHDPLIAETTLLSANPHTSTVFDDGEWLTSPVRVPYPSSPAVGRDAFADVHDLYRSHATEHHAVPPETMADATIRAWRDGADRVVAHWLQPHEPFIAADAPIVGGRATETNVWDGVGGGKIDPADVRAGLRANAERAIDAVERVLRNVDADVLITSDHGNLLGELGLWGHPFGMVHPAVRTVPWTVVPASRTHGVAPDIRLDRSAEEDVTSQLEALGYR